MSESVRAPAAIRAAALALALAATAGPAAVAAPDPQQILAASDLVRNPDFAFGITNTIVEYRAGRQADSSTLVVYSKADPANGQFRSLIRYVAPERDANKLILFAGRELWFYDPASRSSVRMSPQQRLLGQASNGDVVTVNFARDYRAASAVEEDTRDGERQSRHCWRLALEAATADATYRRIDMWIEVSTNRPVKARFHSESGKLLKSAYYRRFEDRLGRVRPTETVIIDGLDPDWVTVMRFSDWERREVPETWLQREYLPRFAPR